MEFPRQEYWSGLPFFSRGSSWPRDQTHISCIAGRFLTAEHWGNPCLLTFYLRKGWVQRKGPSFFVLDLGADSGGSAFAKPGWGLWFPQLRAQCLLTFLQALLPRGRLSCGSFIIFSLYLLLTGEDSWESVGHQSILKGNQSWIFVFVCWSTNTLATWCEELTHWKRPWCWERLRAGGEGGDRGDD